MRAVFWQENLQQLMQMRLMHNVNPASLKPLLPEFQACELEPGEILLTPFKRNNYLYLILCGELEVYLDSLDSQPVRSLGVNDCVGEISFVDNHAPSAYVVARQPTLLLRLHNRTLPLLTHSPALMQNLVQLLCERVRQGNRIIIDSEQNAKIDTLTGAFNRRWLDHVYERESTRCAFNEQPLSMLMLDVDHFKAYNDQHGHLAGDYALCLVAHTLRNQLRPKDSLTRYGGEEFVILLPELSMEEARSIGERLRTSLEQIGNFYSPVGMLPGVTVSIGLAPMRPKDSLQSLIGRADKALYKAKQQGRNCLCS
ncbi:GGDEF domain-containing protein [Stutzerimonas nosocomialis]|uniref:GGDEF domain-containing protein n=1 Tax=Stutzerimonas nosocomialis TaxID=1056496 RepID=UPI001109D25D|nr:GGDEF domain-containing protein [Stutzerimonas nosocomialis]TLX54633.1 GGDEF domain-containing protein [Stutzerimonas nosocomialis]